jgi:manganese-dependent inorganic pyrophosphatase
VAAEIDELGALTENRFDELSLYKGAVFFGHMNPDSDSVGAALGAAEFFGEGIAACPMRRDKCPNTETAFLMDKFNVGLDRLPLLSEIDDLANRSIVLVDFNDPVKGPASTFGTEIPELVSSRRHMEVASSAWCH